MIDSLLDYALYTFCNFCNFCNSKIRIKIESKRNRIQILGNPFKNPNTMLGNPNGMIGNPIEILEKSLDTYRSPRTSFVVPRTLPPWLRRGAWGGGSAASSLTGEGSHGSPAGRGARVAAGRGARLVALGVSLGTKEVLGTTKEVLGFPRIS